MGVKPSSHIKETTQVQSITEQGAEGIRGLIQKFPDWVRNEIYAYNNKQSFRSNTKVYGGKTH
jgi:hypothetical protein